MTTEVPLPGAAEAPDLRQRGVIADVTETSSTIKAVLFDADGVVQEQSPGWLTLVQGLSGDPARGKAFLAAVFDAERPALIGEGNFVEALSRVLTDWNSPVSTKEALKLWQLVEPDPEILAIVKDLRASGIYVGLATNQQAERARFMSCDLGYSKLFDGLLYSFELGCAKPGSEYFALVLDRLRLPAERVLFIDDGESNVLAARKTGLEAVLFTRQSGVSELRRLLRRYGLHV